MKPKLSYTVWFTQRTGSSLLCKTLEETKIAGKPNEWLLSNENLNQEYLWEIGSTSNGVFGLKHSFYEPRFSELIETFRQFPNCPSNTQDRKAIWEFAFPNHKHIFMTRRNKVRLAVSWWKAIQTQEWHRLHGQKPKSYDLTNAYSFEAIHHLYNECSMREAGIQEFFSEGNIVPLTIVYEDFIQRYEQTIKTILTYLELDSASVIIQPPYFAQTADSVSQEWTQRFREELQDGWQNQGW